MMLRSLTIGALALTLAAGSCPPMFDKAAEHDPVKEVIAGCSTITGTLNVLTPNKGRLSTEQIATVDRVVDVSKPICTAEEPPATAVDLITDLAAQLVTIQSSLAEGS